MDCRECDKKLRKVCNRFKKYEEFRCKLEVIPPSISMGDLSDALVEEVMMEIEDAIFKTYGDDEDEDEE